MDRRAQSSMEYIFMITLALVVVYLIIKTFLNPRTGTVKKAGETINGTVEEIGSTINSMASQS